MINVADLRPSQLRGLSKKLVDPDYRDEFVESLVRFLDDTPIDDGASSDLIYTTAVKLSHAKVWDHISGATLAWSARNIPQDKLGVFSEGLSPNSYAYSFLLSVLGHINPSLTPERTGAFTSLMSQLDKSVAGPFPASLDSESVNFDDKMADILRAIEGHMPLPSASRSNGIRKFVSGENVIGGSYPTQFVVHDTGNALTVSKPIGPFSKNPLSKSPGG